MIAGTLIDGRYEILGLIAAGGMGEVYRGRRRVLGDEVAIKVIRAGDRADPELRERFLRESRACAQLRHPAVVTILDYDVDDEGYPFLVMELLNGPSLKQALASAGRMSLAAVGRLVTWLGGAIQLAHDRGIVHRDLKPANVVSHRYDSGDAVWKVIDFGLANMRAAGDADLTVAREFVGTVAYASPEQLRGEKTDARSDIYSFGAVTYELLTGRPPFVGEPMQVAGAHFTEVAPRPSSIARDLPSEVDDIVLRALAKQPADRWPRVADFASALASLTAMRPEAPADSSVLETAAASVAALPALSGWLGKYELGQRLGRGRLGSEIYAGRHRALQHPVAIRTIRRQDAVNWEAVRTRFVREARMLQAVHPSVLQVRDYGEEGDVVYLVTELIDGPSLREVLARDGPIPWPRLTRLARQLAGATSALHRRGAFVCGLNPDILRMTTDDEGERVMVSSAGIREAQDLLGTLSTATLRGAQPLEPELPYVAPEVLMGGGVDVRADVFTLGVLLYEMATARLPFEAATMTALLGAMLTTSPRDPRAFGADVPEPFVEALVTCLAPDPARRFAAVTDFLGALSAAS